MKRQLYTCFLWFQLRWLSTCRRRWSLEESSSRAEAAATPRVRTTLGNYYSGTCHLQTTLWLTKMWSYVTGGLKWEVDIIRPLSVILKWSSIAKVLNDRFHCINCINIYSYSGKPRKISISFSFCHRILTHFYRKYFFPYASDIHFNINMAIYHISECNAISNRSVYLYGRKNSPLRGTFLFYVIMTKLLSIPYICRFCYIFVIHRNAVWNYQLLVFRRLSLIYC